MKPIPARSALLPAGALAVVALFGLSGCNTHRGLTSASSAGATAPAGMTTCALAVAVRGGFEPTPAQWNALYDKLSKELAARGLFLITDYRKADKIINVEFLPDPINPASGTALISSIVPNTGFDTGSAAVPTLASYSQSAYNPAWAAMGAYGNYPYDYYQYDYPSGGVISPPGKPGTPPPKHHPVDPKDCPPGSSPYRPPPSFVGTQPHQRYTPPASTGPSYRTDNGAGGSYAGSFTSRTVPGSGSSSSYSTTASAPREHTSWWQKIIGSGDSSGSSSRGYSSNDSQWNRSSDWSRSSSSDSSWSRSPDYSSSSSSSSSYAGPSTSYSTPSSATMSFSSSSSSSSDSGGSRSTGAQTQSN